MKLKPGLGSPYTIWPGNKVCLFYSCQTHIWGDCISKTVVKAAACHIIIIIIMEKTEAGLKGLCIRGIKTI